MLAMPHQLNRRSFIIASGLTALASTRILGANDTLRVGVIGAGGRMNDLLNAADKVVGNYQIVASFSDRSETQVTAKHAGADLVGTRRKGKPHWTSRAARRLGILPPKAARR